MREKYIKSNGKYVHWLTELTQKTILPSPWFLFCRQKEAVVVGHHNNHDHHIIHQQRSSDPLRLHGHPNTKTWTYWYTFYSYFIFMHKLCNKRFNLTWPGQAKLLCYYRHPTGIAIISLHWGIMDVAAKRAIPLQSRRAIMRSHLSPVGLDMVTATFSRCISVECWIYFCILYWN